MKKWETPEINRLGIQSTKVDSGLIPAINDICPYCHERVTGGAPGSSNPFIENWNKHLSQCSKNPENNFVSKS